MEINMHHHFQTEGVLELGEKESETTVNRKQGTDTISRRCAFLRMWTFFHVLRLCFVLCLAVTVFRSHGRAATATAPSILT